MTISGLYAILYNQYISLFITVKAVFFLCFIEAFLGSIKEMRQKHAA